MADISHCDWEQMRTEEMTKTRRGEDYVEVKKDLKRRRKG